MYSHVIIHYGEIGLKGRNRKFFEEQLIRNIQTALPKKFLCHVYRISGRIVVASDTHDGLDTWLHEIKYALGRVYGIAWFLIAKDCEQKIDAVARAAVDMAGHISFSSFAVRARRDSNRIPFSSQEVNTKVGAALQNATSAVVNLDTPDATLYIEMVEHYCFFGFERIKGAGGLPVGVSGNVLLLLSGGIDSPVAGSLLQRRGCALECIHFHNAPYTSEASLDKVKQLAMILSGYQRWNIRIHAVPFTELQKEVVKKCDEQYRVILYRRFMIRVAQQLALQHGIRAVAVGDSIGQVASQTVPNIEVINNVAALPVFRPLIGFDKEDIITAARRIGTYDVSILPHEDCCSFFMPHRPATKSTVHELTQQEKRLDVNMLVHSALQAIEVL